MAVSLSTFAQTEQKIEVAEQQASQQPAQETSPEASETAVNENGNLENGQAAATGETASATQEATPQPEENVSSFKLGFEGEETTIPVQSEEPKSAVPVFNFDEELKKVDRKEVLKKLGVNDFALEIDEYLAKGGKASDYLAAKAVDYNQVSDEDLIKEDLKLQYPNLNKSEIDRLYFRKYGITEDMLDDEKEDRTIMLKADGHLKRQQKITEQQKFKIPETPILQKDEAYEQWKAEQESQPAMMEKLKQFYQTHSATKALNESKRVAINLGEGVAPFNFSIENPEFLTNMLTDGGQTWQKLTSTPTGEPDVAKQHLIGLFAANPQKVFQDIFNYGVQMGKRKLVEEGQNAQRPQQKVQPPELNGQASYSAGRFGDRQRN